MGVAALAAALAVFALTINSLVRRRLRLSIFLVAAYLLLHLFLALVRPVMAPGVERELLSFEQLALAAAVINLLALSILNPLRADRVPDRFPAILQDFVVVGLLVLVATFVFKEKLLATSAISAVVIGFALQDTLGNAFAGLALQSEKPFRVGHWIRVGEFEGRVAEITWRATKLRTKSGNFVALPNNVVSKEPITNYSEPAAPTRIEVEVGASYQAAPAAVKAAIYEALSHAPRALRAPAPDVLLVAFDSSAMTYRARFWIEDYERDEAARDEVRTAIYYAFARHGLDIPWPIQVEYSREWVEPDVSARQREREGLLAGVDLFTTLTTDERRELAGAMTDKIFGNGEAIVRQGTPGASMFIVGAGRAVVKLEPEGQELASIEPGGYFGEMSLLTGDPRSATVVARGDTRVFEIDAGIFRRLGAVHPQAIERIGIAAVTRRAAVEQIRAASAHGTAVADAPASFVARMKKFLGL
ncbi:MAG: mechanosensitive ion channel family protein [Acidobacteriota bacterium]|nr:mechanosensitive ion channel family protein [Acidobacteriota bacterium]